MTRNKENRTKEGISSALLSTSQTTRNILAGNKYGSWIVQTVCYYNMYVCARVLQILVIEELDPLYKILVARIEDFALQK